MISRPRKEVKPTNFNSKITNFFLNNKRLTILSMLLLTISGVVSLLTMQTSGFPNPEIKLSIVNTIYPGASAQTVVKEITQPLEEEIKKIDGVKSYLSTSGNSFSSIAIYIEADADSDSVKSKIQSAIGQVSLPEDAQKSTMFSPEVGAPALMVNVVNGSDDLQKVFEKSLEIKKAAGEVPETDKIAFEIELKPTVKVVLDDKKVLVLGINTETIKSQIALLGESIPVKTSVNIDDTNTSLLTSVNTSKDLNSLENLEFVSPVNGQKYLLKNLAEIKTVYEFKDNEKPVYSYQDQDGVAHTLTPLSLNFKSVENISLNDYVAELENKFSEIEGLKVITNSSDLVALKEDETAVIFTYNQAVENKQQVDEILGTLFGSKFESENKFVANLGWIFGAIWLVFLVMLAFISWRSAIVSILSFPLSIFFSIIYLKFSGEGLNTIVLFSLVLTIGIVIDLTMVSLEAMQRKIDTGLKGKEAVVSAMNDVGNGLLLAMMTNVVVFVPFAVLSGFMGEIFAYIPKTIIPAIIGSYIVPLIFLTALGGKILKRNARSKGTEEENLWAVSKWFVKFNNRVLHGSRWLRIGIILLAVIIPVAVVGYFTSTGQVKTVGFSSSGEVSYIQLNGSFLAQTPKEEKDKLEKEIVNEVQANADVIQVFSMGQGDLNYYVQIKDKKDRKVEDYNQMASGVSENLQSKFKNEMLEISASTLKNGPPESAYQVSVAVQTEDLEKLKSASIKIGETLKDVCLVETGKVEIKNDCEESKKLVIKVDDGFTNKSNTSLNIILDKQKLAENGLILPSAPASIYVNSILRTQFDVNDGKKVGVLDKDGLEMEIILDKKSEDPKTLEDVKNTVIFSPTGKMVKLGDLGEIKSSEVSSTIGRVKGETVVAVQAGLKEGYTDAGSTTLVTNAILDYYQKDDGKNAVEELGLKKDQIEQYSEGDLADIMKSLSELGIALVLAIFMIYFILVLFFQSFTQPLVVLFTIPLVFVGIYPALAWLGNGEIGFIEIIGIIILVGLVVNVAIFLLDMANAKIENEGWEVKKAISYASGVRFRPIFLTTLTSVVSLLPLAVNETFFKPLALVIIFGLLTSGIVSLFTTPILYVFFKWVSEIFWKASWWLKLLMIIGFPITLSVLAILDWKRS